jgi:hypothetical protein
MNEQHVRALRDGLRALAKTTEGESASGGVERAVLAELARVASRSTEFAGPAAVPPARRSSWFSYAAAAVLLAASVSGAWFARRMPDRTLIHPSGFVEIPGAWALPPIESGSIVRVSVPVSALPQYGVAIVPEIASDTVQAEMFLAQDGVPRSIRVVNRSDETRSSP